MCDPLGRYLLLPLWFTEDFEEESFASSLGIFFFFGTGLTMEESFASSLGIV